MTLNPDIQATDVRSPRLRISPVPAGERVLVDGEEYYRISAFDRIPPFLMSLASDTDLWMFIASSGGLTAGRGDAQGSLFPYEAVDKLFDAHHHTGPITLIWLQRGEGPEILWRPFYEHGTEGFRIERNLYKNTLGNRLIFEEIHRDFEVAFRYRWSGSDEFGLVRTATLSNLGADGLTTSVMDGLRNVLPHGAPLALYQQASSLVNAYKRTDCDPETRMGIFSLTSKILDQPVAAEELRANIAWCRGLEDFEICLSIEAVAAFERGEQHPAEQVLTGRRGNYLAVSSLDLGPRGEKTWHMVVDVGRSHVQLQKTRALLLDPADLGQRIEHSLQGASENLLRIVASADGLQATGDPGATTHHLANVLFNNMRGGVFAENYLIPTGDFVDFVHTRNRLTAKRHGALLESLDAKITVADLEAKAVSTGDVDLQRLCLEYLPLYFGRRHGDPSRPWNRFSIRVRNEDGSRALRYEGNWRDIFQNWEALCLSFPAFIPGIIAKFVNASTTDGFNPYRLTRDGIDWEVQDPDDPWSLIGYWGDHQIIYLLKFLEAQERFSPGKLGSMLDKKIFSCADVPYRLVPYEKILRDPRATIEFDTELAARIDDRVSAMGSDGKLVPGPDGAVHHVSLIEKLLVPALSKLSNLVPDAGIWMNTQRPEWNDANNALVGNGASMVTLCYLRRYLRFLEPILDSLGETTVSISTEVAGWLRRLHSILEGKRPLLESNAMSDRDRKHMLDALGTAFSDYREKVYRRGYSGNEDVRVPEIVDFCREALPILDHAIRVNRREDGLYHAYNLLQISADGNRVRISRLYEMLEGQVAALSSGMLDAVEAAKLVSCLFDSRLYRSDQRSFMLYPERELPNFLDKNVIPGEKMDAIPLLQELIKEGKGSIVDQDAFGTYRFHADFRNADDLSAELDRLAKRVGCEEAVELDRQAVLDLFEQVFDHRSFTGRSGTMYAYEGLGSIYWHMVAKLLLAVQEVIFRAARNEESPSARSDLVTSYYRIRSGLGFEKKVHEYGAFPMDPYSHTPPHGGARQPGMTGQVKEEILTRFGELGIQVEEGRVSFRPTILRRSEFREEPSTFRYCDLDGDLQTLELPARGLAFTYCQVPVVYTLTLKNSWIKVTGSDGTSSVEDGDQLGGAQSRALFDRLGEITRIDVGVPEESLLS